MRSDLPELWLVAQRVRAAVAQSVKRFARYERYTIGVMLGNDAAAVVRAVRKAWLQKHLGRRRQLAQELSDAIDELKDSMQLAKDVDAFRSHAEFESVARLVRSLGQQCGGWLRELHSTGQNAQGPTPGQRASILSSRAASHRAAP